METDNTPQETPEQPGAIDGVTYVPTLIDDVDDPSEWTFTFPNGWGARVDLDEDNTYEDHERFDFRVLLRGVPVYSYDADVRGATSDIDRDAVQQHLDTLAARPAYLEPLDAVAAGAAVVSKVLAAIRVVMPELKDLHVFIGKDGQPSVTIGDYNPIHDYRPELRRIAAALGIEDGWKPVRTLDRWTCKYQGIIEGRPVAVCCEEPRVIGVRPEPTPLPGMVAAGGVSE